MTDHEEERLGLLDGFDGAELMGFLQRHTVSEAKCQQWKRAGNTCNESLMGMQPLKPATAPSAVIRDPASEAASGLAYEGPWQRPNRKGQAQSCTNANEEKTGERRSCQCSQCERSIEENEKRGLRGNGYPTPFVA